MAIEVNRVAHVRAGNVIISRGTAGDYISIWVLDTLPNGTPINYVTVHNGRLKHVPYKDMEGQEFLRVPGWGGFNLLPDLLDALLAFGIQPKEQSLDAKERAAVEKHLADMRKIVGKKLGVEL